MLYSVFPSIGKFWSWWCQTQEEFHCTAYDYSCVDWDALFDHLRYISLKEIFKLHDSVAASQNVGWCSLRSMFTSLIIDVRPSLFHLYVFQLFFSALNAHWNHSFHFTNRINLLHLKWSSKKLLVVKKVFLNLPNMFMLIKQGLSLMTCY